MQRVRYIYYIKKLIHWSGWATVLTAVEDAGFCRPTIASTLSCITHSPIFFGGGETGDTSTKNMYNVIIHRIKIEKFFQLSVSWISGSIRNFICDAPKWIINSEWGNVMFLTISELLLFVPILGKEDALNSTAHKHVSSHDMRPLNHTKHETGHN